MFKHSDIKGEFDAPNAPSRCTWTPGDQSIHHHQIYPQSKPKIYPNILYHIGNTPLIKLNSVGKNDGLQCELLVKCEFLNGGGSVKDRIGMRMIEEAELDGRLKPGMTIIESTSGNTGISLAMAGAVKGYKVIIVMPEKCSPEKSDILKAMGAQVIRTPTEAPADTPESHHGVAIKLNHEIPNSIILNQYRNSANPLEHYDHTAEEILDQCDGKLDMIVAGAGTGGTITGIGRKMREKCPKCTVVAVDPSKSILAQSEQMNEQGKVQYFELEGIGCDFVPTVLDKSVIDEWVKVEDKDAFLTAKRLVKEEGILCGGSSGASVWAALQMAKRLKSGQRCVVILPDSAHNYISKFINDDWMAEHGYFQPKESADEFWWWNLKITELNLKSPLTIQPRANVQDAISIMEQKKYHQLPVVDESGAILGIITQATLMSKMKSNQVHAHTPIESIMYKQFNNLNSSATLGDLSRMLEKDHFAVIVNESIGQHQSQNVINGIVTRIDLLNFVISREKMEENGK